MFSKHFYCVHPQANQTPSMYDKIYTVVSYDVDSFCKIRTDLLKIFYFINTFFEQIFQQIKYMQRLHPIQLQQI